MRIVVLAGGLSPEREVSLTSGSLIANALMTRGHEVLLVDVYEGIAGEPVWRRAGDEEYSASVAEAVPDLEAVKAACGGREALIGPGVLDICHAADVVFVALHGAMGENGQLQATLDNFGIRRYTGSGYIGSLLAMDKDITKRMLTLAEIPNAPWLLYRIGEDSVQRVIDKIGLPCVVKPCSCGSSVGVSIVETEAELADAIAFAAAYEPMVLIERKIEGREFSVAILDGEALPAIEIIPKSGFYDYKNKYQGGCTTEICPAELTADQAARLAASAKAVFAALRLGGYARIDFIMDADGVFWCLEANTLPGMTPTSLMPQEAAAVGIAYPELCDRIAQLAWQKGEAGH
ncbi:MAG: D-alanine--D-alanine ligase [Clostridia bacterium]|nr:D-alanine--D-alanine ligase [Clostridia bacterium]